MQRRICYLDSCRCKTVHLLTEESLYGLLDSHRVRELMDRIKAEPDQEKQNVLKGRLPAVMFACVMNEDGKRPTLKNAQPSGLCIHDWDHLPSDPRDLYQGQINGKEGEEGIVLVHVTPKGHGLRLVTTMREGESVPMCQERLAARFGMTEFADRSVKDITRLSFLPGRDNVLYVDGKALFESEPEVRKPEAAVVETEAGGQTMSLPDKSYAENYKYKGVRFSDIIDKLLERCASDGKPKEGERNTVLYHVAREVRHLCEYRFQDVYQLLRPYFADLVDGEVRSTVNSAVNSNGKKMSLVLNQIVAELRSESLNAESSGLDTLNLASLPKLSPIEEMILSHFPKYLRSQVFMASLPIWGTIGTHIKFRFRDGRDNTLSFMTAVVGRSGSGKSFASALFSMMTKRLEEADREERRKAEEYIEALNRLPDNAKKPEDPKARIRLFGDDITNSQLIDYISNLGGEHGLQFTEEVARLSKSRRSLWGDNDDLYCKAFDNALGGKESKSKLTKNIRCRIFLNTLFCGTPGAMHKFYSNPEGGLNNRIIYAFMPNMHVKGFPRYDTFSDEEQMMFDEVCDQLDKAGRDGTFTELTFLDRYIDKLKAKWDDDYDENPDEVWYDLGKRALVIAYRVGVLEWYLWGCADTDSVRRHIRDIVLWVAESVRASVYAFSGDAYEELEQTDADIMQKQPKPTKNNQLFSLLGGSFTYNDVRKLCSEHGKPSSNVYMIVKRWIDSRKIEKGPNNTFVKLSKQNSK